MYFFYIFQIFYNKHVFTVISFLQRWALHLFTYHFFWLHWVFVATHGLSLAVVSGGYFLVVEHGLLIAGASLVAEHGL